jgi:WD40 repeat protein
LKEDDNEVAVFDAETFELLRRFRGHETNVWSVDYGPDGKRIASASSDRTARVWEAETGRELGVLAGHGDEVLVARFSPDGRRILTAGRDRSVRIWDAVSFEEIVRLRGHDTYVIDVAVSGDGNRIVSASGDSTVRLWDTTSAAERYRRKVERRALVRELTPLVLDRFGRVGDAGRVVESIRTDASLEGRRREVALQIALAESVRRRGR